MTCTQNRTGTNYIEVFIIKGEMLRGGDGRGGADAVVLPEIDADGS